MKAEAKAGAEPVGFYFVSSQILSSIKMALSFFLVLSFRVVGNVVFFPHAPGIAADVVVGIDLLS